jgi:FkbM family methyltransferase
MNLIKMLGKALVHTANRRLYSPTAYKIARKYVGFWNGESFPDPEINGEFRLLRTIAPRSRVIFDIGANIGKFSQECFELNPALSVHAFEPDKECHDEIQKNTALKQAKWFLNACALGDKEESRTFYLQDRKVLNSFHTSTKSSGRSPVTVKVETVDMYCQRHAIRHIDFMKIDTEGHDIFVLKGAVQMLERRAIDFIQFEIARESIAARVFLKDFIDLFEHYGYTVYRVRPKSLDELAYSPQEEMFTYMNFFAMSPKAPSELREKLRGDL